jgi:DNA-binding GntR family transcriptional regulator
MITPMPVSLDHVEPLKHTLTQVTLGRRVAEAIRGDILFGRLDPGTRLAQQQLCERFGVSRMPVRDALRQLTFEGYLVHDSGRHCLVATMSRQDIIDTFDVEGMLHGFAARRLTEIASDEQLQQLRQLHLEMDENQEDVHKFGALNWNFHRQINQMSNSRKVIAALRTLAMALPRDFVVEFPEWVPGSNAEHAEIVKALVKRDGAKSESLMRAHVGRTGVSIAEYLERKGVELS